MVTVVASVVVVVSGVVVVDVVASVVTTVNVVVLGATVLKYNFLFILLKPFRFNRFHDVCLLT